MPRSSARRCGGSGRGGRGTGEVGGANEDTPGPHRQPPPWRGAIGFVLAPALASALVAAIGQAGGGMPDPVFFLRTAALIAAFGAYPGAFFGFLVYLVLRDALAPRLVSCAPVGAAAAVTPWSLLLVLARNP